jgi:hypothetical protein
LSAQFSDLHIQTNAMYLEQRSLLRESAGISRPGERDTALIEIFIPELHHTMRIRAPELFQMFVLLSENFDVDTF